MKLNYKYSDDVMFCYDRRTLINLYPYVYVPIRSCPQDPTLNTKVCGETPAGMLTKLLLVCLYLFIFNADVGIL